LSLQKLTTNRPKLPIMEALPKIKLFSSKIKSCRSARFRNQKGLLPTKKKTRKRNQKVQNIAAKDDGLLDSSFINSSSSKRRREEDTTKKNKTNGLSGLTYLR